MSYNLWSLLTIVMVAPLVYNVQSVFIKDNKRTIKKSNVIEPIILIIVSIYSPLNLIYTSSINQHIHTNLCIVSYIEANVRCICFICHIKRLQLLHKEVTILLLIIFDYLTLTLFHSQCINIINIAKDLLNDLLYKLKY